MSGSLPAGLDEIEGAEVGPSAFVEGPALWVNGTEICHRDREGGFDLRLTRAVIRRHRDRLRADPRVELRPSSSSDWLRVSGAAPGDLAFLAELAELAAGAHRAPPGTTPVPLPGDAEIERRRRFH